MSEITNSKPTQGKRDRGIRIFTVWFKDEPFLSTTG
jgi:hypothetical protein